MNNYKTQLILSLFLLFILNWFFVVGSYNSSPPAQSREALNADISLNLLEKGTVSTGLWGDLFPRAETALPVFAPGQFLLTGFVFKLNGFSLSSLRLVPVVFSFFLVLALFTAIEMIYKSRGVKDKIIRLLLILNLIVNGSFILSSQTGRPEIIAVFFLVMSLGVYLYSGIRGTQNQSFFWLIFSGILTGLAVIFHYFSLIYLLLLAVGIFLEQSSFKFRLRQSAFYILGAFMSLLPLLIYILLHFETFNLQMNAISSQGYPAAQFLHDLFQRDDFVRIGLWTILPVVSMFLLFYTGLIKTKPVIILFLTGGWAALIFGKSEWYAIFTLTGVILSSAAFFATRDFNKSKMLQNGLMLFLFFITILQGVQKLTPGNTDQNTSYKLHFKEIIKQIPADSTVYLSTSPDYYFEFKENGYQKVYYYPGIWVTPGEFEGFLNNIDYLVIDPELNYAYHGISFTKYLYDHNRMFNFKIVDGTTIYGPGQINNGQ